mgnify:CR=1 FL=1
MAEFWGEAEVPGEEDGARGAGVEAPGWSVLLWEGTFFCSRVCLCEMDAAEVPESQVCARAAL